MKKGNTVFTLMLIFLLVVFIMGFTLYKCMRMNKRLIEALPSLIEGEKIDYFELIGTDETRVDASALTSSQPCLIFIFSRPCSPCNKNIVYWKKMVEILGDDIHVYGIILGNLTEAINFSEGAELNFNIYVPTDVQKFGQRMRLKLNSAQTIVYDGGVRLIKLGDLEGEEAVSIIKFTRGLI